MKRDLNQNLSGNEVYYTACFLLVILNNSYSKPHCQKGFNLNPFSYKSANPPASTAPSGNVWRFPGGLVCKAHRLCGSLNSRLESNKEVEKKKKSECLASLPWSSFFGQIDRDWAAFENNYFTEMCSGSEAGSYLRIIDFVYHSTRGLVEMKKKKDHAAGQTRHGNDHTAGKSCQAERERGRQRERGSEGGRERERESARE